MLREKIRKEAPRTKKQEPNLSAVADKSEISNDSGLPVTYERQTLQPVP
jgi:hypothetical protein